MASHIPSDILDHILDFVGAEDLLALARTNHRLCKQAQKRIFARPIPFIAHEDDGVEKPTSPEHIYSFVFALLSNTRLRGYVKNLWLDFGCYCPDNEPEEKDAQNRMANVRVAHQNMELRKMTSQVRNVYNNMDRFVAVCTEDHVWYAHMFSLILCYVPRLRDLTIWIRNWGRNNPHSASTESHMTRTAGIIESKNRLPELRSLTLLTWADATDWTHDTQPISALLTLPSVEEIHIDDVLTHTRPKGLIGAKELTIRSPKIVSNNRGERPDPAPRTVFIVNAFLALCSSVRKLEFTPRSTIDSPAGMILQPLSKTLTHLRLPRSLDPGNTGIVNLSSLQHLKTLEINWTYLTYAFADHFSTELPALDLVENLPSSLEKIRVINTGRLGEVFDWTILQDRDIEIFQTQLDALAWSRYKLHRPSRLTVIFDVFPTHRAETLRRGFTWPHAHWHDFTTYLKWKNEVRAMLGWAPKETMEVLWEEWCFAPGDCQKLKRYFAHDSSDVVWEHYYEAP